MRKLVEDEVGIGKAKVIQTEVHQISETDYQKSFVQGDLKEGKKEAQGVYAVAFEISVA